MSLSRLPLFLLVAAVSGCLDYGVSGRKGAEDRPADSGPGDPTDGTGIADGTDGTDGTEDTGPAALSCDGTPAWDDPDGDGALRLTDRSLGLDAGPWSFSMACVQDAGLLNICEDSTLDLGTLRDTVVGGLGMRNVSGGDVTVTLTGDGGANNVYLLVDLQDAPMEFVLAAPDTCLTLEAFGPETLTIGGVVGSVRATTQGTLSARSTEALRVDCANVEGAVLSSDEEATPTVPTCG